MRAAETHDVVAMVTMFGEDGSRSRSHGLRPEVIAAQAARLRLPSYTATCSWPTYTDQYLKLLAPLEQHGVTHLIFGDIAGDSHRAWNERVCAARGLTPVMPLWGESTLDVAREFIARGGEALLVTVRPPQLDDSWLGLTLDGPMIDRLIPLGVDPCGERGEFHTVVTNCPAFSSPLLVLPGRRVTSNGCHALDVELGPGPVF
jgi:uncharacterized protein (TIGR00290 family)